MCEQKQWVLYILECKDGSLYTGITNDLKKRITSHQAGTGAKYTRGRTPVNVRYVEKCEDHSSALRREVEVKKLLRPDKIRLCDSYAAGEVT